MEEQVNDSLWVPCPICGCKTRTKVNEDTVMINFPLFLPQMQKGNAYQCCETENDGVQMSQTKNAEPASLSQGGRLFFFDFDTVLSPKARKDSFAYRN